MFWIVSLIDYCEYIFLITKLQSLNNCPLLIEPSPDSVYLCIPLCRSRLPDHHLDRVNPNAQTLALRDDVRDTSAAIGQLGIKVRPVSRWRLCHDVDIHLRAVPHTHTHTQMTHIRIHAHAQPQTKREEQTSPKGFVTHTHMTFSDLQSSVNLFSFSRMVTCAVSPSPALPHPVLVQSSGPESVAHGNRLNHVAS